MLSGAIRLKTRAHAERAPQAGQAREHRMVRRGEDETASGGAKASLHALGIEIDFHPEALEHVGRTDASADRPIAVLGDRHAGRRRDQRRAGRDVERAGAVAAGPGGIEHVAAVEVERARPRPHRARAAGQFGGRLALELERDQEARDQRLGRLAVEDLAHHALGAGGVERAAGEHRVERVAQFAHAATCLRKFASSRLPSGVPIDSGWNWMPSIGNVRCRSPMTSPSAVRALTSRHDGIESAATSSE